MKSLKEIGIGSFRSGNEPNGRHIKSPNLMGPTSNADSVISQRQQQLSYYIPDEDLYDDEDLVLEGLYKDGKFCLLEALKYLSEINADDIVSMSYKISNRSKKSIDNLKNLPDLEDKIKDLDEMSAGGAPGVAVPMGYTSKGKPETPSQRKKRQKFNREKSFPYR